MKYESAILKRLIDTYGVVGNPHYISEIIKEFIVRGKECFPNLFTYQADWLAHIDEFGLNPTYTVSYTGHSFYAPNTLEKPVKSAILTGKTLVNSFNTYDYQYGGYWGIIKFKNELMTTSKKYIAIIQYLPNGFQWAITTENGTMQLDYSENLYGIFTPTVNGSESNFFLHINDNGVTSIDLSELEKVKPMIIEYQEGMENWDIPYFEGMTSCKMPVLRTVGSNLINSVFSSSWNSEVCNYEKLTNGYVLDNTISRISSCHNLENLIVGEKYTFSCDVEFLQESSNNKVQVYFDDSVEGMYGPALFTNGTLTWTFTYNKKFDSFRLYLQTDGNVEHLRANITHAKINIGETALVYEPYKSNILTVNEEVELGSVGEVKDELNLLTGQLTQQTETRAYQEGDESNSEVLTDMTNTRYKLPKEVIKTVDLSILDQNGENVKQLMSFNGGTHFTTTSQEGSLLPTLTVDVVTDLEETLNLCSTDGNTL